MGTSLATFVPNKHLELADPQIVATVRQEGEQLVIELTAPTLARFVELSLDGADAVFSDNYFDLPARRSRSVTTPLPAGWTLPQVQAALQVRSLYEAFAR